MSIIQVHSTIIMGLMTKRLATDFHCPFLSIPLYLDHPS